MDLRWLGFCAMIRQCWYISAAPNDGGRGLWDQCNDLAICAHGTFRPVRSYGRPATVETFRRLIADHGAEWARERERRAMMENPIWRFFVAPLNEESDR